MTHTISNTSLELLKQGAEARIYKHEYLGHPVITKQRFRKSYRHPSLDTKLTNARLLQEVRLLLKARQAGVKTPKILFVDVEASSLILEFIPGPSYRDYFSFEGHTKDESLTNNVNVQGERIGLGIAKLHQADIVHGDLTTSNLLYFEEEVYLIDFGLAYTSTLIEDKAVDLYVLERAIHSTHPTIADELIQSILDMYKKTFPESKAILRKLDEVRLRGRKRSMVG